MVSTEKISAGSDVQGSGCGLASGVDRRPDSRAAKEPGLDILDPCLKQKAWDETWIVPALLPGPTFIRSRDGGYAYKSRHKARFMGRYGVPEFEDQCDFFTVDIAVHYHSNNPQFPSGSGLGVTIKAGPYDIPSAGFASEPAIPRSQEDCSRFRRHDKYARKVAGVDNHFKPIGGLSYYAIWEGDEYGHCKTIPYGAWGIQLPILAKRNVNDTQANYYRIMTKVMLRHVSDPDDAGTAQQVRVEIEPQSE